MRSPDRGPPSTTGETRALQRPCVRYRPQAGQRLDKSQRHTEERRDPPSGLRASRAETSVPAASPESHAHPRNIRLSRPRKHPQGFSAARRHGSPSARSCAPDPCAFQRCNPADGEWAKASRSRRPRWSSRQQAGCPRDHKFRQRRTARRRSHPQHFERAHSLLAHSVQWRRSGAPAAATPPPPSTRYWPLPLRARPSRQVGWQSLPAAH